VPCVITSGGLTSRVRWPYSSARSEGAHAGCFSPPCDLIHILWCYSPYAGATGKKRPSMNFNYQLSRPRVVSEHIICMLNME